MAFSAFWAGMTNQEVVKSLNFLLDNNEIFIDSTCLFERFKKDEYRLDRYKRHLVYNNYIDPTFFDTEFFSNNDDFYDDNSTFLTSFLFTSWLPTEEHNSFKVYYRFEMSANPLNKDIEELRCVTLDIYDVDENDFKDIVSIYSEKYGSPEIRDKKLNSKKLNSIGLKGPTLTESFVLNEMRIIIGYQERHSDSPDGFHHWVPCKINEYDFTKIHISYHDLLYDNLIDKEEARILKIKEFQRLKEEGNRKEIQKENELYRKKELNNRI